MTQGLEPLDLSRKSYSVICCFLIWCSQWDLGFYRLIVEGEDKLLFHEVVSTSPNLTDFGTIVEDIRDFCNYFFHISFNVISKSCNMAATCQDVSSCFCWNKGTQMWTKDSPPIIQSIVNSES